MMLRTMAVAVTVTALMVVIHLEDLPTLYTGKWAHRSFDVNAAV